MTDSVINLRLIRPGVPDEAVTIQGDCVLIGRSLDCDLRIDQPYVSKRHVRIFRGYVVVDLESRNGTFIEGVRVTEPTLLDGSRICLGDEDAVVEIIRGEDEDFSVRTSKQANAEIEQLRKRNKELATLVMHLEEELSDTRRNDPELADTIEIRQALQERIEELEATKLQRAAGNPGSPAKTGIEELETENKKQLETLKQVEAELERARKQLDQLRGEGQ